jgi:hypothetical protein
MKQRKTIKIDEKEITIKELTVDELIYLCSRAGWMKMPEKMNSERFNKLKDVPVLDVGVSFVSDIKKEDCYAFAPSEIRKLYDVFIEVNQEAMNIVKYLGVDKIVEDMKANLMKHFMGDYSKLLAIT